MVQVQLGSIQGDAWSNQVGVFTGQNIQNAWDSHSPDVSVFGTSMGDYSLGLCFFSALYNFSAVGQPTYDSDWKGNGAPLIMR